MSTTAALAAKPFRIGMLGAGTVGGGVYELITQQQNAALPNNNNRRMVIAKICVRNLDKPRDFTLSTQHSTVLTTNPQDLLSDDIDCVVEVAGGCSVAKDIVLSALQQGKAVVTANKALLAEHMTAVEQAAVSSSPCQLGYEAAVCGGIPIINALSTAYVGDRIQSVAGICNGTTNFMLSAMAQDRTIQYADILRQAQELGYAEADPAADVEGHDVRAKIAILAKLAFGQTVAVDEIPCAGITKITSADFEYAQDQLNCTIKLIGTARCSTEDQRLSVYVTPTLVPLTHMLAGIHGSGNCVSVQSQNMGTCHFTGPGAGRFPTANSIVADIYRAAAGTLPRNAFPVPGWATTQTLELDPDYEAQFYIRIPTQTEVSTSSVEESIVALGSELGLEVSSLVRAGENLFAVISWAKKLAVDQFCHALVERQLTSNSSSSSDAALPLAMPIMKE